MKKERKVVNLQINGMDKDIIKQDARDHSMTVSEYVIWLCNEERKRFIREKDEESEIWKPIRDYEGLYEVSNKGRLRTLRTNKILTPKIIKGYCGIRLYKNGKDRQKYIHRIVAEAFIPNPDNLPQVNHKDENPKNNSVDNLEWCTPKYNVNYGTCKERSLKNRYSKIKRKKTVQLDKSGKVIQIYNSILEASRKTGFKNQNIQACCAGKGKTCHGFVFKYLTDDKCQEES